MDPRPPAHRLPPWAAEAVALYESNAASQFILYGNVNDRFALPGPAAELVDLSTSLRRVLLPRFDVVLGYDLGSGLRVEQGAEAFARWPSAGELTAYFADRPSGTRRVLWSR